MAQWTAQSRLNAYPDEVLMLLTEPEAISGWAPIAFDVVDFDGHRLMAGDCVRVEGQLVGRRLEFEVDVDQAHDGRLALTAHGPIRLDVEYEAVELDQGSELRAAVTVSGGGFMGRVLAQATDALLAAGALRLALERISRQLDRESEFGLEPALAA
jgi:hypothetical protein